MYGKEKIGIDLGGEAIKLGTSYVNKALDRGYSLNRLRRYFQIDNAYVIKKIALILFPYQQKEWGQDRLHDRAVPGIKGAAFDTREGGASEFREHSEAARINTTMPDLYIPTMASVTYILLLAAEMGVRGVFYPEKLGGMASKLLMLTLAEVFIMKVLGFFMESAGLEILDAFAFTGYKYVAIIAVKLVSTVFSRVLYRIFLVYFYISFFFFLSRSLKSFLLVEDVVSIKRQMRVYFLFTIVLVDICLMYFLN